MPRKFTFGLILLLILFSLLGCDDTVEQGGGTATSSGIPISTPTLTPPPTNIPSPTTISVTPTPSPTPTSMPAPTTVPVTLTPTTAPLSELSVHFIDVGQGDSILIDLNETEILIDAGDRSPGVVDYLKGYVDGDLEVVIATHPHADHIGGLIEVLQTYDVEQVWTNGDTSTSKTYTDFVVAYESEGAEVHVARLHDTISTGDLSLFVHNPANLEGSTNNNSMVLSLSYGTTTFMFMGDAEQEAESHMTLLSSVQLPDVDVLKVGHHGSRTASSPGFISLIQPETAIIMCGEDNPV